MRIKIVIADEQKIGREGLSALFRSAPDMEVLGDAADISGVMQLTEQVSPDVVLLGIEIGEAGSLDIVHRIRGTKPDVRVIGLSDGPVDGQQIRDFLSAGGAGFITKSNGFADFLNAVRLVMAKRIYLSPDVAEVMVDQYILRPNAERPNGSGGLTPREREVLQLVAEGMSTKEAAAALKISGKTVDMHRQNIMNKLALHSVAELTKYAIREGITPLNV